VIDPGLDGRVALVTGANHGIVAATAPSSETAIWHKAILPDLSLASRRPGRTHRTYKTSKSLISLRGGPFRAENGRVAR
jgi:hypothetical protein